MDQERLTFAAREIMIGFADQTGLSSPQPPRRYLWTDAFAVCNFLGLYRQTGEEEFRRLALALVDQVHRVLGRHRDDDPRTGWISGLGEQDGAKHPTAGGLRIGKSMNERAPDDPWDERLEWDRDGQYFHYLTKWMHALSQAGAVSGDSVYIGWATELAKAAHAAFTYVPRSGGQKRMYWKMSIDLTRPLVPSMGHHDPLDALVTYSELRLRAQGEGHDPQSVGLDREIAEMTSLCAIRNWDTDDPLGLGGLLFDAYRALQMAAANCFDDADLPAELLGAVEHGLSMFLRGRPLEEPAAYRLAFRELGLSIGLHGVARMQALLESDPGRFPDFENLQNRLQALQQYRRLAEEIEVFWMIPENRRVPSWTAHGDINAVMLATSLSAGGFLSLSL